MSRHNDSTRQGTFLAWDWLDDAYGFVQPDDGAAPVRVAVKNVRGKTGRLAPGARVRFTNGAIAADGSTKTQPRFVPTDAASSALQAVPVVAGAAATPAENRIGNDGRLMGDLETIGGARAAHRRNGDDHDGQPGFGWSR